MQLLEEQDVKSLPLPPIIAAMSAWQLDAQWDRPAKLLSAPSTHYLLLRIAQAEAGAAKGGNMLAGSSIEPVPESTGATAAQAGNGPLIAIALDCSRSMAQGEAYQACAEAAARLVESLPPDCCFQLAVFSKAVSELTAVRHCGSDAAAGLRSALAQVKVRSVSRLDLALEWQSRVLGGGKGPEARLAILLTDGGATDAMGYEVEADSVRRYLQELDASGAAVWIAGIGSVGTTLTQLTNQANSGSLRSFSADSAVELASALQGGIVKEFSMEPTSAIPSIPLSAGASGQVAELRLRLESRQHGLDLMRACRLRPSAGNLEVSRSLHGWELAAGPVAAWQEVQVLLELRLPASSFGATEGRNSIIAVAVLETDGTAQTMETVSLDYTPDLKRAQQLNAEVDHARRLWDLAGVDAWTAQSSEAPLRRTGVLPPAPGFAGAPPVGGVPQ